MSHQSEHLYEFGPFRIDAGERLLLRDGDSVPLTPKAFDLLLALVECHGHLLEKDELMKLVWPDTFVEEANLSYNISIIRKALGDGENGQRYIETVPKRGYRFVASVKEVRDDSSDPMVGGRAQSRVVIEREPEASDEGGRAEIEPHTPVKAHTVRRWIKVGSIVAVAALVIGAAAAIFFHFNRAPALTERDSVLLADFVNTTGDDVFDGTLKQGLAVQLEQSPFLNIFPEARVREALKLMNRSPEERMTREVAREVCQRQGIKALIAGTIAPLGSHYVITLEAIGHSGEEVARSQEEAESKEQVLKALGKAASKLREKLGESLSSIQKFDAPIWKATTSSLEALKAYSLAREQNLKGNFQEAVKYAKRAVELDPNFAIAYTAVAVNYNLMGESGLAAPFAKKGFELRDRASELEKPTISAFYYSIVTREIDKTIEALESLKQTYPRDISVRNLLGNQYALIGQYENAIEEFREDIRLTPSKATSPIALSHSLMRLNRFAEAQEVLEQSLAQKRDHPGLYPILYSITFVNGDTAGMKRQIDWASARRDEYVHLNWQAETAAFAGQLRRAQGFSGQAFDVAQRRNLKEITANIAAEQALRDALFGNCQQAKKDVTRSLAIAHAINPLRNGALALSLCGEVGQALFLADELAARYPKATLINAIDLPVIRAAIELRRGNSDQAIQLLQSASRYEGAAAGGFWSVYLRGQAYLLKRAGTEAAVEFQKILDHRGWGPTSYLYPLAHLGLARAIALTGDTAKSRQANDEFFALWKDADPDIPILKQARQEYEKLK